MVGALAAGGSVALGGLAPATATTAGWITVADHGSIEVGGCKRLSKPDGRAWMVTRVSRTGYRAFTAYCTHQGGLLSPRPTRLYCPGHGSEFSRQTGAVLQGPAPRPLEAFQVRVRRGKIQILG
jgi:nitrite reductase/ring-hydroxylating ferredoxin subunit